MGVFLKPITLGDQTRQLYAAFYENLFLGSFTCAPKAAAAYARHVAEAHGERAPADITQSPSELTTLEQTPQPLSLSHCPALQYLIPGASALLRKSHWPAAPPPLHLATIACSVGRGSSGGAGF